MTINNPSETAKAVVRRNTEEVQGGGNFDVFDELFADDFLDHTPQPGRTPDKAGARELYRVLRAAFPDFHADIHWQIADGDRVTTYKTYHGTHQGDFLGVPTTGRKIQFETVDVMRVRNGKIVEHWGVANLFSVLATARRLARQVGSPIAPREALVTQSQAGTAAFIPGDGRRPGARHFLRRTSWSLTAAIFISAALAAWRYRLQSSWPHPWS